MKTMIILALLILAGCTAETVLQPRNTTGGGLAGTEKDIELVMLQYGAFTPMDMARSELRVNRETTVFRLMDSEGKVTYEYSKKTDKGQYTGLLDAVKGFSQLDDLYSPKEGDPMVTDVGTAEFTLIQDGVQKTVKVDPYFDLYMPEELKKIDELLTDVKTYSMILDEAEAKALAEAWIKKAPTYAYDGSGLEFKSFARVESYPEQYALEYRFTSSQAGYGDRSDQMSAQVMTPHTIKIIVSGTKILSAVIDDKWDELVQIDLTVPVEMRFQPMQCQDTPWQRWYKDGGIQFVKAPTEEEVAIAYFSTLGIDAKGFRKVDTDMAVCQACDICPATYYYSVDVPYRSAESLIYEGFVRA